MSGGGTRPVATLGEFVGRLAHGSRCFCCGTSLRRASLAAEGKGATVSGTWLVCPQCGSEVSEGEAQPDIEDADSLGGSLVILTAA